MNRDEKKTLDTLAESVNDIKIAIVGNEKLGIAGLVKRQEVDERKFKIIEDNIGGIRHDIGEIKERQEKQWSKIDALFDDAKTMDGRVKQIEKFFSFIKSLPKYKKKLIAAAATIATLGAAIIRYFDNIKHWIEK